MLNLGYYCLSSVMYLGYIIVIVVVMMSIIIVTCYMSNASNNLTLLSGSHVSNVKRRRCT